MASIENDVRSACLGEMWKGVGQGKEHIVLITLGTGLVVESLQMAKCFRE